MSDYASIAIAAAVAAVAVITWLTARLGPGYKSKELQHDDNSPVPTTEEEKMQRVSAIVATSVIIVGGLVLMAAMTLRG